MNILIISGHFFPQNTPRAFRTTALVKEYVRRGDKVTLYIPDHITGYSDIIREYPFAIKTYKWRQDVLSSSKNKLIYTIGRLLVYAFDYPNIFIYKDLQNALCNESGDYDMLLTIAAPHQIHWAIGRLYSKGIRFAKKWVADCGDPYMLCGTLTIPKPFYYKHFETRWCRNCDYITVPVEGAKKGYYPEFESKIKVIPQAFDFTEVERVDYEKNQIPTFAYSGSLWPGSKDPSTLLDYLSSLNNVPFCFYIYTNNTEFLQKYKESLGEKLILSNFIPRLELLKKLSSMDFLINFEFSTGVQSPSKMIDYTLTGRPIISMNCKHLDIESFYEFLNGDYEKSCSLKNIEDYNIKTVAKQIADLQ